MAIEINPSTPSSPIPTVNGISVIWLGDWVSNKVYRRNEGVFYDGSSYRANKTTSQTPSLTATDWDLLAQGAVGSESSNSTNLDGLTDVIITSPVNNNLLTYESSTSTWNNKTASQIGLASLDINGKVPDSQIPDSITRDSELTGHTSNTNNPHNVTATQVGKDTAQWNSDRIKGVVVDDSAKSNGKVLKYNSSTNTIQYADDLAGGVGGAANLSELGDVTLNSPSNGQAVIYNSSTAKWTNQTLPSSGEVNTASNVGTAGVGVFKRKTGVNLEFKNLNAGSSKISITDDTINSEIDIDVNEANLTLGNLGGTLPISKGGTGSTTAAAALTSLGAASSTTLTAHTGNTSNPHNTTAAQVGAIATTEKGAVNGVATLDSGGKIPDAQIPDAITRDSELTAHTSNTSNPHSVTAAQVGNTTAQWNADKIQGVNIHTATPTNGQVLTYSTANSRWEPQTPTSSGGGKVLQVVVQGTSSQLSVGTQNPLYVAFPQLLITPSSVNSKVLVRVSLSGLFVQNNFALIYQLRRMVPSNVILQEGRRGFDTTAAENIITFDFLDSPNTTSLVEYGIYLGASSTANIFLNYIVNSYAQGYSSITLMEIAP